VALFALAADPRLTVGVVSCGLGTLASFEERRISHNPAWFVPGLAAAGDVQVVAGSLHEQRVLVSAGVDDALFPLAGVRAVLGSFRSGVCAAELFDGGHELPPAILESALSHLTTGP
jgi:predicted esterase